MIFFNIPFKTLNRKKNITLSCEHFHLQYTTKFVENLPSTKKKNIKKQFPTRWSPNGKNETKILENISHHYNNIFAFHMHI
jgi:hypothetical protein